MKQEITAFDGSCSLPEHLKDTLIKTFAKYLSLSLGARDSQRQDLPKLKKQIKPKTK